MQTNWSELREIRSAGCCLGLKWRGTLDGARNLRFENASGLFCRFWSIPFSVLCVWVSFVVGFYPLFTIMLHNCIFSLSVCMPEIYMLNLSLFSHGRKVKLRDPMITRCRGKQYSDECTPEEQRNSPVREPAICVSLYPLTQVSPPSWPAHALIWLLCIWSPLVVILKSPACALHN